MESVTFVDEDDIVIGSGERKEALRKGLVRRVTDIFILNLKKELLIQKRALVREQYPGLWDSAAGGHVDFGEEYDAAARRELEEELGLDNVPLQKLGKIYTAIRDETGDNRRFSMLYSAKFNGEIKFNSAEVSEVKWLTADALTDWIQKSPNEFTYAFRQAFLAYERFTREN